MESKKRIERRDEIILLKRTWRRGWKLDPVQKRRGIRIIIEKRQTLQQRILKCVHEKDQDVQQFPFVPLWFAVMIT
jgi:hypothetical protein